MGFPLIFTHWLLITCKNLQIPTILFFVDVYCFADPRSHIQGLLGTLSGLISTSKPINDSDAYYQWLLR